MAWRIHDSVQRGEIDNRERGVVRGKIWLRDVLRLTEARATQRGENGRRWMG